MKRTAELNSQSTMRWYAERPFAYKVRESYQSRMITGLVFSVMLVVIGMASYYISIIISGADELSFKEKKRVEIDVAAVPPPPPQEVQKQELVDQSSSGEASNEATVSQEASDRISSSTSQAVSSALSEAMAGLFSEGGGLPTPSSTALGTGDGAVASVGGASLRADGATGFGGGVQGLGGSGDVGFGGSGAGAIGGPGRTGGIGGGIGGGLGIGGGKGALAISANFKKMTVSTGGRTQADIEKVINAERAAVDDCYRTARNSSQESIRGEMVLSIFIRPDGGVADVKVVKSSIKSQILERCLQQKIRRFRFTAAGSNVQKVDVPYTFTEE